MRLVVGSWQTAASRNKRAVLPPPMMQRRRSCETQSSLTKGTVIEAHFRSWMFGTTFQRLQIKPVCAVAPQECKLGGSTALCLSRLQPPNPGSCFPRPTAFQIELLNSSVKRFNPLVASAKPKRRQSSDTHNLPIANRTGSTARRQYSTPLLVLNLEMDYAPCLWQTGHLLHSLRPPQKVRTQPSRCYGASPLRLMILYRDHVLIGCLFWLSTRFKAPNCIEENHRLAVATSTVSYQQPSCSSLQPGARGRLASKCLTSSPSVKIETRFYPFVLISGRIEWPHTKSDTLISESLSVKHVYIMTMAAFGFKNFISASHLQVFSFTFVACFLILVLQKVFRSIPDQFAGELSLTASILSFSTFSIRQYYQHESHSSSSFLGHCLTHATGCRGQLERC